MLVKSFVFVLCFLPMPDGTLLWHSITHYLLSYCPLTGKRWRVRNLSFTLADVVWKFSQSHNWYRLIPFQTFWHQQEYRLMPSQPTIHKLLALYASMTTWSNSNIEELTLRYWSVQHVGVSCLRSAIFCLQ